MKKRYIIIPALILSLGLFIGCSSKKLPEGFNEVQVVDNAKRFIENINNKNYENCYSQFSEIMKNSMTEDSLKTTFDPILESLGAFKEFKKVSLSNATSFGTDYAVCIVTCQYEKGEATYTVSLDKEMLVGGLYIK